MPMQTPGYRPEIDGLRAVAVLPVILFHAGLIGLPGGFLGVDVFFVISGFLITQILLRELSTGQFSILGFYDRRARRILPALFVVMFFTLPFAWALMPPDALQIFFRSLPATAWFFSNVHFFRSFGYFSPDAELQPLLHTWSLAVEEQFYIVFPLLLALVWRLFKSFGFILAAFAAIGFLVCLAQLNTNQSAAFYLPHARIWELLVGAVVAVKQSKPGVLTTLTAATRSTISMLALASLMVGFVVIDDTWPTPGFANMVVVLATAAILAFVESKSVVGRLLSSRPLVAVGLISYSAYLWHYPLFAFARLSSVNVPPFNFMLGLAVLSLVLAYFSWRWVEGPFRQKGVFQRRTVFGLALTVMLAFGIGGFVAERSELSTASYTPEQLALVRPELSKVENCEWQKPVAAHGEIEVCEKVAASSGPVVLWGDSHAAALFDQFNLALRNL